MAVYTITQGEKITASILNTYAMNAGLVYVTSQTIGSAVSSVAVSNCFSSTYDNYRILVTGGVGSTNVQMILQVGAAVTQYYWGFSYTLYGSGTLTTATASNTTSFQNAGYATTDRLFLQCDLFNPNLAKHTQISGNSWYYASGNSIGYGGELRDTTQHTGFTISPGSGTMTGGTITVYGYRKA